MCVLHKKGTIIVNYIFVVEIHITWYSINHKEGAMCQTKLCEYSITHKEG